jgi:hypothetical protein
MSYIGEYQETPYLEHQKEGDPFLRDFKALKHFKTLRPTVTRASHGVELRASKEIFKRESFSSEGSRLLRRSGGRVVAHTPSQTDLRRQSTRERAAAQFPPTERSVQEGFRKSVVKEGAGQGALSSFRGALITERLKTKQRLLAQERDGLV